MKAGIISTIPDRNLFIIAKAHFDRHGTIVVKHALKNNDKHRELCRWLETRLKDVRTTMMETLGKLSYDIAVFIANLYANRSGEIFVERHSVVYDCREGYAQLNETLDYDGECERVLQEITKLCRCDTLLRICEMEASKHGNGRFSMGWSRESERGLRQELKKERGPGDKGPGSSFPVSAMLWPYIDHGGNMFIKCTDARHCHPIVDAFEGLHREGMFLREKWGLVFGDADPTGEMETHFGRW